MATTKGTASFTPSSDAQEGSLWDAAAMLLEAAPPADDLEAEHARAVSDLSRQIGAELGLGGRALEALALGAFLHDVGKNAVPEAVLLKPGPLTPPEWELVKGHPESGERMARAAGYPRGPAGDQAPPRALRRGRLPRRDRGRRDPAGGAHSGGRRRLRGDGRGQALQGAALAAPEAPRPPAIPQGHDLDRTEVPLVRVVRALIVRGIGADVIRYGRFVARHLLL